MYCCKMEMYAAFSCKVSARTLPSSKANNYHIVLKERISKVNVSIVSFLWVRPSLFKHHTYIISHCDHCLLCIQKIRRKMFGKSPRFWRWQQGPYKYPPFQSLNINQNWKFIFNYMYMLCIHNHMYIYFTTNVTNWQQIKALMVSQSLYSSGHQGFRSVSAKKLPWTTLQDKGNASKWPRLETLCLDSMISMHRCSRCLKRFCISKINAYHLPLDFIGDVWISTGLSSPSAV